MIEKKPTVNSWTEFGDLEYVCVGTALNACYPDKAPIYDFNWVNDEYLRSYFGRPLGPRPAERVVKAMGQLQGLVDVLEGEEIKVGTLQEVDSDIQQELKRKRSYVKSMPQGIEEDKRIRKKAIVCCRPAPSRFDNEIKTPSFKSNYQLGNSCPRDTVITIGNTILESASATGFRFFESNCYRDIIYKEWMADQRIQWKTAPKPSCGPSLFHKGMILSEMIKTYGSNGYKTPLNESEVAFDAADMMRVGRDIFYKKSVSANNKGIDWMRREFPDLRFHMLHFPTCHGFHLDGTIIPLRPPTSGSEGILLLNQNRPPLLSEMEIFKRNDWKLVWAPLPSTNDLPPIPMCTANLNMNMLSLSPNSVIIEECEVPMYNFLEDLGWDVITVPLRALNEFGGGVHCVTWDIRRNDTCRDYFPIQDYETECGIDLNNLFEQTTYPK